MNINTSGLKLKQCHGNPKVKNLIECWCKFLVDQKLSVDNATIDN